MVVRSTLDFVYFNLLVMKKDTRGQVFSVGKRLVRINVFKVSPLVFFEDSNEIK